ncbi:MAG: hypothetical protein JO023_01380 [Chloroflexi bacterium]|nr:hypothetical protein [Chloroflexota bacterium]
MSYAGEIPELASLEKNVPGPLAEYAERLLLSTGLSVRDVLRIASGAEDPPAGGESIEKALRAGWSLADSSAVTPG